MNLNLQSFLFITVLCAGVFATRPLINLNLWVYRKLRLFRLARFWQRQLGWWIPAVRVVCATGAVFFVLVGLGMIRLS